MNKTTLHDHVEYDPVLGTSEAASYLNMHVETLRRLVRSGQIACIRDRSKAKGAIRFRLSSLNKWVARLTLGVEERCMGALETLERMRPDRESRKQLRKKLARETEWRQELGSEIAALRARVIELEDTLDPDGALKRAGARAQQQAIAEEQDRSVLFGSGTGCELQGLMPD